MEFFLIPSKVLRFGRILMEGEDMEAEGMIKMGQRWIWNKGCCRRMVLGRRLGQPSNFVSRTSQLKSESKR